MKKLLKKFILWILNDNWPIFEPKYKYVHQFGELAALSKIPYFEHPEPNNTQRLIDKHGNEIKTINKRIDAIIKYIDNKIK